MQTHLRYYLDEDVKRGIAVGLQARGVDVLRTQDAGLSGARDKEQLQFAFANHRVIITHDSDYIQLHSSGVEHAGILYCHQGKYGIGQMIQIAYLYHMTVTPDEMRCHFEFL